MGKNIMKEERQVQDARAALAKYFPEFLDMSMNFLLGSIWNRPGLSQRDRSLITVAVLTATSHSDELGFHIPRALTNGVTKDEIREVMVQMAFYAGWPAAISAMTMAAQVYNNEQKT